MADLDAELLALAGGDSSEDEGPNTTTTAPKVVSPSSAVATSHTNPDEPSTYKSNTAAKPSQRASATTTKATRKAKTMDSEEEGEASSSSQARPNSLDSAPMSESDADSPPNAHVDTDGPIFPLENRFYSEKDKAEILSLSEIQRESILAERAQLHERKLQDLHLRRILQARDQNREGDKKKRKAGPADLEDGQRKSSRQKTTLGGRKVRGASGAIAEYKRQREERKGMRDEQRVREGDERKDRKGRGHNDDGYSDADADGESEVEWDDGKAKAANVTVRNEQPAELIDFERVRVGRDNFAKVCFYPGFDDAIKNCFARVNFGPDKATGDNIYRVAQIKGFTEGRPYAMEGVNGKPFTTNQYAIVAMGKTQKEWPFLACSNSKFTELEFIDWKKTMTDEDLTLPTKTYLINKIKDINTLLNHRFTDEEIQIKLTRSGVLQSRFASLDRVAIAGRRKVAVERGDEAAIAKLDAELAALDGPKLAFGTSLRKAAPKNSASTEPNQQERLAALNRANRKANTQDVRRAQQAERKAEALARKAIERGEAVQNPFARVKTRAKFHHDVYGDNLAPPGSSRGMDDLFGGNSRDISRSGTPLSVGDTNSPKPSETPKRSETPLRSGEKISGLPRIGKRNMDDDVFAAMDFGIEIDI